MSLLFSWIRWEADQDVQRAKSFLSLASDAFNANPELTAWRALLARRSGDEAGAVLHFWRALHSHPDRQPFLRGLAHTLANGGQVSQALAYWENLIEKDPRQALPLHHYIELCHRTNHTDSDQYRQACHNYLPHLRRNDAVLLDRCVLALADQQPLIGAAWLENGRVSGWIYNSASPSDRIPVNVVVNGRFDRRITPDEAFPMGFAFQWMSDAPDKDAVVDIFSDNGTRLSGMPLRLSDITNPPRRATPPAASVGINQNPVDVLVPVFGGRQMLQRCVNNLLATRALNLSDFRMILINDRSPDPELGSYLRRVASADDGTYIENEFNVGFVGSINRAMFLHRQRDVVWLNSDAFVSGNWLDRLRNTAYSDYRIATVTPLSNNAQLFSYPEALESNPLPDDTEATRLDDIARLVNDKLHHDCPTGIGFCLYVKRAAIDAAGELDDTHYIRGYNEEIDYCFRLGEAGWKHVCATDVFVAHAGNTSFKFEKQRLVKENDGVLKNRYPYQYNEIKRFRTKDPLRPSRSRIERVWLARTGSLNRLHIACESALSSYYFFHVTNERKKAGQTDLLVLLNRKQGMSTCELRGIGHCPPFNLRYTLPKQQAELAQDLASIRIDDIEVHYTADLPDFFLLLTDLFQEKVRLRPYDHRVLRNAGNMLKRLRRLETLVVAGRYSAARYRALLPAMNHCSIEMQTISSTPPLDRRRRKRPASSTDPINVAVIGNLGSAQIQADLWALTKSAAAANSTIRFLAMGEPLDEPPLASTGRFDASGWVDPKQLPELIAMTNCDVIFNPQRRPDPDPSGILLSQQLDLSYAGYLHGDSVGWLASHSNPIPLSWRMPAAQILDELSSRYPL